MGSTPLKLGEPDFISISSVRLYCERARTVIRPMIGELEVASSELWAVLREIPGERIGNVDAKVKARLVSRHLKASSNALNVGVVELVRTYQSLLKHFNPTAPEAHRRRRRPFDLNN